MFNQKKTKTKNISDNPNIVFIGDIKHCKDCIPILTYNLKNSKENTLVIGKPGNGKHFIYQK